MHKIYFFSLMVFLGAGISSCENQYDFPLKKMGGMYWQHFTWKYEGHRFDLTIKLPVATYTHYHIRSKTLPYDTYTKEDSAYRYMRDIAYALRSLAKPYRFNNREMAEYILSFVQALPYVSDPPEDEYSRAPAESLMERREDCEDFSICFCSICSALGYYTALIEIPEQEHMAAGIDVEGTGDSYKGASGRGYLFCECTSAWPMGQSSFPNDSVMVFEIPPMKTANSKYPKNHSKENSNDRSLYSRDKKHFVTTKNI
jgi:hypothetical protein